MSIFRRHSDNEDQKDLPEEFDFPFHVLWADQETSSFPIVATIQIVMLALILIRVFLLK